MKFIFESDSYEEIFQKLEYLKKLGKYISNENTINDEKEFLTTLYEFLSKDFKENINDRKYSSIIMIILIS